MHITELTTEDVFYNRTNKDNKNKYIRKSEWDEFLNDDDNDSNNDYANNEDKLNDELSNYHEYLKNDIYKNSEICDSKYITDENKTDYHYYCNLINFSNTDHTDICMSYPIDFDVWDKHLDYSQGCEKYIELDIDTITNIYLRVDNQQAQVSGGLISIDDLKKLDFFNLVFELHIGEYKSLIHLSSMFLQLIIRDVSIEYGDNCIKFPLFIFNKMVVNGFPLTNLNKTNRKKVYIAIINVSNYDAYDQKNYKLHIDITGKCYNNDIHRSTLQIDTPTVLIEKIMTRSISDSYINFYGEAKLSNVPFIIFSIFPKNYTIIIEPPKIKLISLKEDEYEPIEYNNFDLIEYEHMGVGAYILTFDPYLRDMTDIKQLFCNEINERTQKYVKMERTYFNSRLKYKIIFEDSHSLNDIIDKFMVSVSMYYFTNYV